MRVFLDTNVLVSAFATRGLCADVLRVALVEHQLVLGETVLGELRRVLETKLGLPSETVEDADAFLRRHAIVISDAPTIPLEVRDSADRVVVQEALAGEADILVTGDRDLLELGVELPVAVLSPRHFWDGLRSCPGEED